MTGLSTFSRANNGRTPNLGYIVLGYLLERISGQTYEEFVQENYFQNRWE